jgi:hypothetical protein
MYPSLFLDVLVLLLQEHYFNSKILVYKVPRKTSSSMIEACLPVKVVKRGGVTGLYKDTFS